MATYILGAIILVALFFALKHVANNLAQGKEDCYGGCGGCSGCTKCGTSKDIHHN